MPALSLYVRSMLHLLFPRGPVIVDLRDRLLLLLQRVRRQQHTPYQTAPATPAIGYCGRGCANAHWRYSAIYGYGNRGNQHGRCLAGQRRDQWGGGHRNDFLKRSLYCPCPRRRRTPSPLRLSTPRQRLIGAKSRRVDRRFCDNSREMQCPSSSLFLVCNDVPISTADAFEKKHLLLQRIFSHGC